MIKDWEWVKRIRRMFPDKAIGVKRHDGSGRMWSHRVESHTRHFFDDIRNAQLGSLTGWADEEEYVARHGENNTFNKVPEDWHPPIGDRRISLIEDETHLIRTRKGQRDGSVAWPYQQLPGYRVEPRDKKEER